MMDEVGQERGNFKRRIIAVLQEITAPLVDAIGLGLLLEMELKLPLFRVKYYK